MNTTTSLRVYIAVACFACAANADSLKLRNGNAMNGVFLGASARQIDFMTQAGEKRSYPVTDVSAIAFSSNKGGESAPAESKGSRRGVTIPAGTVLRVRTLDPIDVDTSQTGARFNASIDDPVMIGGAV